MFTGIRTGGHGELGCFLVVSNIGLSFFWFLVVPSSLVYSVVGWAFLFRGLSWIVPSCSVLVVLTRFFLSSRSSLVALSP